MTLKRVKKCNKNCCKPQICLIKIPLSFNILKIGFYQNIVMLREPQLYKLLLQENYSPFIPPFIEMLFSKIEPRVGWKKYFQNNYD